jgi:hypothetical protein
METLEELKKYWEESHPLTTGAAGADEKSVETAIRKRIRREKNVVMEYFWSTFVYQIMIYAFASHLVIKHWSNMTIVGWSVSAIVLYLPFTVILMKRFKSISRPVSIGVAGQSILANVQYQYSVLSGFFRFKKGFDWVGIPLSAAIIVIILFNLFADSGVSAHLTGAVLLYAGVLAAFIATTHLQNRKRFIQPLQQLESVLKDLANHA